jgi:hypothetical protein
MLRGMRRSLVAMAVLAVALAACAPRPTPSPSPSAAPTSAAVTSPTPTGAGPSASAAGPALTWVGDPITVAEAIDRRDHHLDDTELTMERYSWRPAGTVYCPLILPASPAMAACPDNLAWISDTDPGPQTGPNFVQPTQPAIQLLVRPDTYAQVPLPPQPGRVITMGHFDDHRSADCPTDQVDACRRNFIVDAILDPDAPALDRTAIDGRQIGSGSTPVATPEQAVAAATSLPAGADRILVASPVLGSLIGDFEPKASAVPALVNAKAVWLIRYLATTDNLPVVKTALVTDGPPETLAGNVYAVTPEAVIKQ